MITKDRNWKMTKRHHYFTRKRATGSGSFIFLHPCPAPRSSHTQGHAPFTPQVRAGPAHLLTIPCWRIANAAESKHLPDWGGFAKLGEAGSVCRITLSQWQLFETESRVPSGVVKFRLGLLCLESKGEFFSPRISHAPTKAWNATREAVQLEGNQRSFAKSSPRPSAPFTRFMDMHWESAVCKTCARLC